ncbi:MAG: UDP-2,3-diacylglucosamine diphosphatase [Oceanospirillaceae bacterium]|nr:UDP-2,3-diacylglucosamine diphosphatase [Oceanospirillaceae bacterium]
MTSYFISDLHLEPERPAMARGFLELLSDIRGAEALYILGDFFEVWMGDDFDNDFVSQIKQGLRQLSDSGTRIYLMPGNRDFLLGDTFCQQTGATMLEDPTLIDLHGTPLLLMHGDSLCTQDVEYMKLRQMFRSQAWQQEFLSKSLQERIAFARHVRSESQSGQQMKSNDIMDVTPDEVDRCMAEAGVRVMIHGHTHLPADHRWEYQGQAMRRIVLGDWSDTGGWLIRAEDAELTLESFDF